MRNKNLARLAAAVSLSILAQPVAAQISEMDRLQRCQNNRNAIALLEAEIGLATDERIARMDLAERTITSAWPELRAAVDEWQRTDPQAFTSSFDYPPRLRSILDRITNAASAVDVYCPSEDGNGSQIDCVRGVPQRVNNMRLNTITSMSASRREEVRRQIAAAQSNLVALRCDQARAPDVADIGGTWRGLSGSTYSITQSGNQFSWTRSGSDERGAGTISGSTMSAQYSSSQGSGASTGTIQLGPNGVAVQIRWSNGDVYTRQ